MRASFRNDPRMYQVYLFVSDSIGHLATAVSNGIWMVPRNRMNCVAGKAALIKPGDRGIFFLTKHSGGGPALTCPFEFMSSPDDSIATEYAHLYPAGKWQLGFRFKPLGDLGKRMYGDEIAGLEVVGSNSAGNYNHALNLSPVCLFVPVLMPFTDWETILHKTAHHSSRSSLSSISPS